MKRRTRNRSSSTARPTSTTRHAASRPASRMRVAALIAEAGGARRRRRACSRSAIGTGRIALPLARHVRARRRASISRRRCSRNSSRSAAPSASGRCAPTRRACPSPPPASTPCSACTSSIWCRAGATRSPRSRACCVRAARCCSARTTRATPGRRFADRDRGDRERLDHVGVPRGALLRLSAEARAGDPLGEPLAVAFTRRARAAGAARSHRAARPGRTPGA